MRYSVQIININQKGAKGDTSCVSLFVVLII